MGLGGFVDETLKVVVPQAVTDVKFRTSLTPTGTIINSDQIIATLVKGDPTGGGVPAPPPPTGTVRQRVEYSVARKFFEALKPTFIVESPTFGQRIYAPYGVAGVNDHKRGRRNLLYGVALFSLGLVGAGFVLGYKRGRSTR